MTFTTLTFLIFLALFAPLYWGIPRRKFQNGLIVVFSYIFYGWWDWRFCGLMFLSCLTDYFVAQALDRTEDPQSRKRLLGVTLAVNLGTLGFFKYFNFFADNLVAAAASVGWTIDPVTLRILLPVGISFYTFQTLSYSLDVYRRHLKPTRDPVEYLAFVSFFPQLVAGPIERAPHLLAQFQRARTFDPALATDGCRLMLWGCVKKLVIADNLSPLAEAAFRQPTTQPGLYLALGVVAFAFQIYCDFSAYSDIARGLARLFGFDLMRNFTLPYFSQSMGEFWRRWHISLSSWFRDYVYVPLGGSRVSHVRRAVNLMITFLLSGFWHGASWNFVLWGAINGAAILPETLAARRSTRGREHTPGGESNLPDLRTLGRILLTFTLACCGWIFFRARNFADALAVFGGLSRGWLEVATWNGLKAFLKQGPLGWSVVGFVAAFVLAEWITRRHLHPLAVEHWPRWARWTLYTVLIWLVIGWGSSNTGQFIYFQF